jgi:hypothetical protein
LNKRDCHRQLGRRVNPRQELDADVTANGANDAGQVFMSAAVEDRDFVAGGEAEHARQVLRFVARKRHRFVAGVERRSEESVHRGEL